MPKKKKAEKIYAETLYKIAQMKAKLKSLEEKAKAIEAKLLSGSV